MGKKCTPCEQANREIFVLRKSRIVDEAKKFGQTNGVRVMAIGIDDGPDGQKWVYVKPGDAKIAKLRSVEYLSVM